MSKKYTNKSKLLGKIGTENYRVSNCPVHLPKENIKFFMAMQDAGNKDPFSSDTWGNQITPGWKKSIYEAILRGVKNALNEINPKGEYNEYNQPEVQNEDIHLDNQQQGENEIKDEQPPQEGEQVDNPEE